MPAAVRNERHGTGVRPVRGDLVTARVDGFAPNPQTWRQRFRKYLAMYAEDLRGLPTQNMKSVADDVATLFEMRDGIARYSTKARRGSALKAPDREPSLCELVDLSERHASNALQLLCETGWIQKVSAAAQGNQATYVLWEPADKMAGIRRARTKAVALKINLDGKRRDTTKAKAHRAAKKYLSEETSTPVEGDVMTHPSGERHDAPLKERHDAPLKERHDAPPLPIGGQDNRKTQCDPPTLRSPGADAVPPKADPPRHVTQHLTDKANAAARPLGSAGRRRPRPRRTEPMTFADCTGCDNTDRRLIRGLCGDCRREHEEGAA